MFYYRKSIFDLTSIILLIILVVSLIICPAVVFSQQELEQIESKVYTEQTAYANNKDAGFIHIFISHKTEVISLLSLIIALLLFSFLRIVKINRKLLLENELRIQAQNKQEKLNKELKCLYDLANLSDKYQSIENYLQDIVNILPRACEIPQNIAIKITYKNKSFQTENFDPQLDNHQYDIVIHNNIVGKVEFNYMQEVEEEKLENINERQNNFLKTAVKEIESILQRVISIENLKLIASVFEHTNDGIVITDSESRIIDVNQSFSNLTGYSREEVIGSKPSLLQSGRHNNEFYHSMWKSLNENGEWKGQVWNKKKNGEIYAELLNISAIRENDGVVRKYIGVFSDITSYKKKQEELEFLAHHDPLTQLPNRVLFIDRLKKSMAFSQRSENMLAIAYLDLDGFKPVNDTYGHDTGDTLLVEVARRILDCVREGDSVARLGGDEFAILLNNILSVDECNMILERILMKVSNPYLVNEKQLSITTSIGVTLYPLDGADTDGLLRHADQAMYAAKTQGKNQFHLFNYSQDAYTESHHESNERIEQSFYNGEFTLQYQPRININNSRICCVEAILLWQHPERGLLQKDDFISLISDQLLITIDKWTVEESLSQLNNWRNLGHNFKLTLNLSKQYLSDYNFIHNLESILTKYPDLNGSYFQLEVSEKTVLDNVLAVSENIDYCQRLGFNIILNNFGSGYSSLASIKQASIDTISIDPTFVQGMLNNDADYSVVAAVVSLSKSFQHKIIAKGVDTQEQAYILNKMGCDILQGDYFAQAMDVEKIPGWIRDFKISSTISALTSDIFDDDWRMEDLPFILVEYHHTSWVNTMLNYLKSDDIKDPPTSLSHRKCYFGKWYEGAGKKRYGNLSEFQALGKIHQQIHDYADQLCELKLSKNFNLLQSKTHALTDLRNQMLKSIDRLKTKVRELNNK